QPTGYRLYPHAGHSFRRTGCGLDENYRSGASRRRQNLSPAMACRNASRTRISTAASFRSRALAAQGQVFTARGPQQMVTPRALAPDELSGIVEQFRRCAENAQAADFDGVELHGGNG